MIGLIFNWSYSRFRNRFWSIWETIHNYWTPPFVFWSSTEPVVVSSWFVGTNGDGNVESLLNLMIAVTCDTPSVEGAAALCAVARQQLGSSVQDRKLWSYFRTKLESTLKIMTRILLFGSNSCIAAGGNSVQVATRNLKNICSSY